MNEDDKKNEFPIPIFRSGIFFLLQFHILFVQASIKKKI